MNPKVLVVGDSSVIHTGFGRVVKEITTGLFNTGKYDIKTIGWFHWHGQKNQEVVPYEIISTRPSKDDMYAQHTFNEVVAVFKPDVVLAVGDVWMVEPTTSSPHRNTYKLLVYVPIDGTPLSPRWKSMLEKADKVIAYGNFGVNEMLKIGVEVSKMTSIPHGVDNKTFFPMGKEPLREKYKAKDIFVVGTVCRNQPRKNIPKLMQAFCLFAGGYLTCESCGLTFFENMPECPLCKGKKLFLGKAKDEARLYMHMAMNEEFGWNIPELINRYNLSKKVITPSDMQVGAGVSSESLAELYNIFDIFTLPTMGEGWGLPIAEAMACGIPCVVTDYSGHLDFCAPCSELIRISDYVTEIGSNIDRAIVDTMDYVMKLDKLYYDDTDIFIRKWGHYIKFNYSDTKLSGLITGTKARSMLGQASTMQMQNFSWDKIVPQWDALVSSMVTTDKKSVKIITERA